MPESTQEEMKRAATSASEAFKSWKDVSTANRVRIMLQFQHLIRNNMEELAANITKEQGKTLADARGDVFRGLEVVEHCCTMGTIMMGETAESVSKNLDTYSYRIPLGVCAGMSFIMKQIAISF